VDSGERHLIDAVHLEERLVTLQRAYARVEELLPHCHGHYPVTEEADGLVDDAMHALVKRWQHVGLAREVIIKGCFGEAHPLSDLPEGSLVVALLDENVERHVKYPLAGAPLVANLAAVDPHPSAPTVVGGAGAGAASASHPGHSQTHPGHSQPQRLRSLGPALAPAVPVPVLERALAVHARALAAPAPAPAPD
jgi:hypothetical protein